MGVTTAKHFRVYECIGGPYDGLRVALRNRARNVILIDQDDSATEYLDLSVEDLTPSVKSVRDARVLAGLFGKAVGQLLYSGWLTQDELKYARALMRGS